MKAKAMISFPAVLLMVALVAGVCWVISAHAQTAHAEQAWTSQAVLNQLKDGREQCQPLEVAGCPFATNHDKRSPHFGELSPQARALCCLNNYTNCAIGVFGLGRPPAVVYVTGYSIPYWQWQSYNKRDACVVSDAQYLNWLIGEALKP